MSQFIKVIVTLEVPDNATEKDIQDFIDVVYGECGSMKLDNPCRIGKTEISDHEWGYDG